MNKENYILTLENEIKQLKESLLNMQQYGLNWTKYPEKFSDTKTISFINVKDKEISQHIHKPTHMIIEGENYLSLKYLEYEFKNKVNVIYIDPPYNTGNKDFIYNDDFIDKKDDDKHSRWLSFMYNRLVIAKELLSQDGIIFVNIDEYEHANLELLMNSIFGEENKVEDIIWMKNSNKNNTKTLSTIHEYVLMYAKDKNYLLSSGKTFKKLKYGVKDLYEIRDKFLKDDLTKYTEPHKELEHRIRAYLKKHKNHPEIKEIINFNRVEENTYKIFGLADMSAPNRKGLKYEVLHPITKKPCKIPTRGWVYKEETMRSKIDNNFVYFGKDETTHPYLKKYLENVQYNPIRSVIHNNDKGILDLNSILNNNKYFNNPKPVSLIKMLIDMVSEKDSVILDFFAGSGTTGQAVLELNRADEGNRQFILCTNNENNICEDITYKRISSLITGYTNKKGQFIKGIPNNLKYLQKK